MPILRYTGNKADLSASWWIIQIVCQLYDINLVYIAVWEYLAEHTMGMMNIFDVEHILGLMNTFGGETNFENV